MSKHREAYEIRNDIARIIGAMIDHASPSNRHSLQKLLIEYKAAGWRRDLVSLFDVMEEHTRSSE